MPAMDLRILAKMTGQFRETIFILAILPCGADNVHNEVQGSVLDSCVKWDGSHISVISRLTDGVARRESGRN